MFEALLVSQVLLWLVVAALTVVIFALARQIGVLHERVAPLGAMMTASAVKVGDAAPVLEPESLDGRPVRIGGQRGDGKSQLLLFVSPTCPMCKKLLSVAKSFARGERGRLELILVGDGDRLEQQRFIAEQKIEMFPYLLSPMVGMTFQVGKLPYAVLIDAKGVVRASGLVNSREHLESLLEAQETGYASIQEYLKAGTKVKGVSTGSADAVANLQRLR